YVEFLNYKEIDKSSPLLMSLNGLAANHIELDTSGINPFIFRTASQYANDPVSYVSFWNACRFVNWLGNGQGDGDTETGAYTLSGYNGDDGQTIARNPGAALFLPTIDEWYKAAYYTGTGYLQSDSASAYGTVGQYGNGWEWTDSVGTASSVTGRILGGGIIGQSVPVDFKGSSLGDPSKSSGPTFPVPVENSGFGFRVAAIPEPATMLLLSLGGLLLRKKK
ncbi:MAG: PEP-CTERM sorting domain-containing protein, partial [Phycisphaerae bacterium]